MYKEKLEPILDDLENKEIEIAGGSVVGMNLAIINSLIKYISNLTLGKKNYEEVQDEVKSILLEAKILKTDSLQVIDQDKVILEKILDSYKRRKEDEMHFQIICRESVEFCMEVLDIAFSTLKLADRISKVGNRMLSSDFKISKYYAFASVESAIVNVEINLNSIKNEEYVKEIKEKYTNILEEARRLM